ncbi:tetratricopeptide repeat protein [Streptomyces diastatochromogenes]|nr:tetratricopeptide repeat protein [Streptomyces diastatochromogenes]
MASLRETRGCREEAVELMWKGHDAGDATALLDLVSWYEEDGDDEAARRLVPEIIGTGHPEALLFVAEGKELAGSDGEVERLARAAAELGWAAALTFLGRRRMLAGELGAAERYFRRAIAAGDHAAAFELARMRLVNEDDVPGAVAAAYQGAELGDFFVLGMMAQLVRSVDPAEGERMARNAAALGGLSPARMVNLSFWEYMGRQQGLAVLADHAEATDGAGAGEAILRAAAEEGDMHAMAWLAQRQWEFGDLDEAEHLYEQAAEGGHAPALVSLARMRREAGHVSEAERLCRVAVDAENRPPWGNSPRRGRPRACRSARAASWCTGWTRTVNRPCPGCRADRSTIRHWDCTRSRAGWRSGAYGRSSRTSRTSRTSADRARPSGSCSHRLDPP